MWCLWNWKQKYPGSLSWLVGRQMLAIPCNFLARFIHRHFFPLLRLMSEVWNTSLPKDKTHNIRSELVVSRSPRMFFSRKLASGWRQRGQEWRQNRWRPPPLTIISVPVIKISNEWSFIHCWCKKIRKIEKIQCRNIEIILSVQCLDSLLNVRVVRINQLRETVKNYFADFVR